MNMITIDAHSRDMIQKVVDCGKTTKSAFEWLSQLRTYWDESVEDAIIRICDAVFPYGYEYLGNGSRLVITPLTDRIYITATQVQRFPQPRWTDSSISCSGWYCRAALGRHAGLRTVRSLKHAPAVPACWLAPMLLACAD